MKVCALEEIPILFTDKISTVKNIRGRITYEMIKKINPDEVPDEKVKTEWLKNKLVVTFNHMPIQEDEELHEVIRTSRYSKMRVNVNFKHNIIDPI